ALRGEATGTPSQWLADVAATAKRPLKAGEVLDGEGGYTVWGKLLPVERSLELGAVPLGLAHDVRLKRGVAADTVVTWDDVDIDTSTRAYELRRMLEGTYSQ